ncbi:MAG: Leucine--tRNA ligase [Elusimicrobia bacterium]|nr:Leucine--tRNA ligase [Elusimicrobiota bacterium]
MSIYNFKEIESKWQQIWADRQVDTAPQPNADHPPYYLLVMFPYPSGNLHMGHVRNYTIGDVLARFQRRKGRSVLHPIGWDSFGLPAENAAIKHKTDPATWTWKNIETMRKQLKALAISYDWDREVATCHPDYYRWNQWLFIKMYEKGLAYRKKAPVNWCDSCVTVLANEQVHEGRCWRCDSLVSQKELEQWFFRITQYAEELLTGHTQLKKTATQKGWPDQVLTMQNHWIGKSWGAHVDFETDQGNLRVFTTRPDTLFGATFMVIAPEHPQLESLTTPENKGAVEDYRQKAKTLTRFMRTAENREKTGVFTGRYAKNPLTGSLVPIWVADYVLTDYGTGAIMAVPAHDQRDYEFATKFNIDINQVIAPSDGKLPSGQAYEGEGLLINSGPYTGLTIQDAQKKMSTDLEKLNRGAAAVTYKLRDWLLSRQRYWGTPIPMVYCSKCGMMPVNENELPVTLPTQVEFTGIGASPLASAEEWIQTPCPKCHQIARRETDTMDTFIDSSWYYARYTDPHNEKKPFEPEKANQWLPVTQYVGGSEHACMHLIYSRFFHKVLRDMGFVKCDEPFQSLLTQGMVTLGGSAMSKSKGNVVDPNDVIGRYGADTCRLFILFAAPPTQQLEWSDKQIEGIWRFLNRVWRLAHVFVGSDDEKAFKRTESEELISAEELIRRVHLCIHRVTRDIEDDFGFNTAIAAIMELVNSIYLYPHLGDAVSKEATETVVQLLSPFAPHMADELWGKFGHQDSLTFVPWPKANTQKMISSQIEIVVQVNGKLRDKLSISPNLKEEEVKEKALESLLKKGTSFAPKRVIYVPNKLVNFVG